MRIYPKKRLEYLSYDGTWNRMEKIAIEASKENPDIHFFIDISDNRQDDSFRQKTFFKGAEVSSGPVALQCPWFHISVDRRSIYGEEIKISLRTNIPSEDILNSGSIIYHYRDFVGTESLYGGRDAYKYTEKPSFEIPWRLERLDGVVLKNPFLYLPLGKMFFQKLIGKIEEIEIENDERCGMTEEDEKTLKEICDHNQIAPPGKPFLLRALDKLSPYRKQPEE